jgi:pimeloyl-ACP methyl ester carboxylesterase
MRRSLLGAAALGAGAVGGAVLGFLAERTVVDPAGDRHPRLASSIPTAVDVRSADGTRLAAVVAGPADGPAIVLVHGLSLSQEIWSPQRQVLQRTMRVVSFDLRGHGDSDDAETGYAVARLGEDVTAVVEALTADRCVVVGHSMGGMALLAGLADRRDLLGDRVAGVVLINSAASAVLSGLGGGTLAAGIAFVRERVRSSPVGRVVYGGLDEEGLPRGNDLATLVTRMLGVGQDGPEEAVDVVRRLVLDSRPHVAGEMWRTAGTVDLHDAARGVTVPALVVAGQRDRVLPPHHSRRLADLLPDADLVELPDVGHVAMLERPDRVHALLDGFIRRVLGRRSDHGAA